MSSQAGAPLPARFLGFTGVNAEALARAGVVAIGAGVTALGLGKAMEKRAVTAGPAEPADDPAAGAGAE